MSDARSVAYVPDSPADLDKSSWFYIARRSAREFSRDECTDIAAALTYYAVLAIFPALIALLSLAGFGELQQLHNRTYGALAGVIVFLLWLWITNLALLYGAELDSELERARELEAGLPAEVTLQLPPRDTTKIEKDEETRAKDIEKGRKIRKQHAQPLGGDDSEKEARA